MSGTKVFEITNFGISFGKFERITVGTTLQSNILPEVGFFVQFHLWQDLSLALGMDELCFMNQTCPKFALIQYEIFQNLFLYPKCNCIICWCIIISFFISNMLYCCKTLFGHSILYHSTISRFRICDHLVTIADFIFLLVIVISF